jgi:Zn-dependent M28 family amino/carboxypeptidase
MKLIGFIFFLICLFPLQAQNFKNHILVLANDSLGGRPSGTLYESKALNYIFNSVKKDFNIIEQDFYFTNSEGKSFNSKNILAYSKQNNEKDSLIILMAHYDHLNCGDIKSKEILSNKKNQIHNGADDNASGVSMIIELGKYLSKKKNFNYNILLLFTAAHEPGLFGSREFVSNKNLSDLKIKTIYNFDMVGRLDMQSKILGISSRKISMDKLNEIALKNGIKISIDDICENTDLKFFLNHNFSLINITTGIHEDYHKISDDFDKINFKGMKLIYKVVKEFILDEN